MTYFLTIKSGTDTYDYEDMTEAQSKEDAIQIFMDRTDFDKDTIERNIFI